MDPRTGPTVRPAGPDDGVLWRALRLEALRDGPDAYAPTDLVERMVLSGTPGSR